MKSVWIKTCAGLISILFLSHCGPGGSAADDLKRFGRANYDLGQCSASPFEGDSLEGPLTVGPIKPLSFFNKPFYQKTLGRTYGASSYSIAESLFREGVAVYQVIEEDGLGCRYFDFLNPAPKKAFSQWQDSSGEGGSAGSLLGLYTVIYSKNNKSKKVKLKTSTIMVLQQTQKWTLLHEMSHYLFAKARVQKIGLKFNSELEESVDQIFADIVQTKDQFIAKPTKGRAQKLNGLYNQFFQNQFLLDRRTALEEFTIEAMLLDDIQKITGIHNAEDASQAFLYMKSNGERISFSYNVYIDELKSTLINYDKEWEDQIENLEKLIDQVKRQVGIIEDELEKANFTQKSERGLFERFSNTDFETRSPARHNHFDQKKFDHRHSLFILL